MNFAYGAAEEALRERLIALCAQYGSADRLRGCADAGTDPFDDVLWHALSGALSAALDDADRRTARLAATVAAQCAGAALAPVPLVAALTAWASGIVPELARVALAIDPALTAGVVADGERVSAALAPVADGASAEMLLIAAGPDVLAVDLRGADVRRQALQTLDLAHGAARVELDGAPARRLPGAAAAVAARAAILTAFEQVGGAQRCLDLATAYARERYAFGQPIGAFQAVKHKLAQLHVEIELARSNAYFGAWALAEGTSELIEAACLARASATPAYALAAQECIHLHGGVGFTWENEGHLHLRRARALEAALGPAPAWGEHLLGLPGAVAGF